MKKIILFFLIIIHSDLFFAQIDSTHFLNFYYGLGIANPMGSISKQSQTYNGFGKIKPGLNIKAGAEYLLNSKHAISIDFDYGLFFNSKNDTLINSVKRRIDSYGIPNVSLNDNEIDVSISTVCIGYSYLFNFKKFTIQAKANLGRASFAYDYVSTVVLSNSLGSSMPTTSITVSSLDYSFNDYYYFTAKPELILKYPIKKKEKFDLMLGLSVSYFYARPNMTLYETKDSKTTELLVIKDKINSLNLNISLNFILKKSLLRSLFS